MPVIAQFASNNHKSASTKLLPFFNYKDFCLFVSFDVTNFFTYERHINKLKVLNISKNIWKCIQKTIVLILIKVSR